MQNPKSQLLFEQTPRNSKPYHASVIVTSDTCSIDKSRDQSGEYVCAQLKEQSELFASVSKSCVADEFGLVVAAIKSEIKAKDPALLITIGGTGLCPRDITPEACVSLYERECNGIVAALHSASLRYTPHAALSRLTSGIINETLVINFPGSLKACRDCIAVTSGFIEHALEQVRYNAAAYKETHNKQNEKISDLSDHVLQTKPNLNNNLQQKSHTGPLNTKGSFFKVKPKISAHQNNFRPNLTNRPASLTQSLSELPTTSSNARKLDARSSRLTIKDVLDSRKDLPNSVGDALVRHSSRGSLASGTHTNSIVSLGRPMKNYSKYDVVSHTEALQIMKALSSQVLSCQAVVSLSNFQKAYLCIGDVLAEDLKTKKVIPPFSSSTMDGYVINVPPAFKSTINKISDLPNVPIVDDFDEFKSYQADDKANTKFFCYQVNTGGQLPERNFAVIPVEKTKPGLGNSITISQVKQGCFVRKVGCDLGKDDILPKGTVIGPVELGIIMAMQHKEITVLERPKLGFLSTGDELVSFFGDLNMNDNKVIDTNGPLLTSSFRAEGFRVTNFGIVKDDHVSLLSAISGAVQSCDILIITGGASMGTKDIVKDTIQSIGGHIHFGRVNIKPGKPASFCSLMVGDKRKFVFSLPGNPVSAYVTSQVLVSPFLSHAIEHHFSPESQINLSCIGIPIEVIIDKLVDIKPCVYYFEDRLEFIRAKIIGRKDNATKNDSPYLVAVSMRQQSSCLLSLMECDCLIMIHPNQGKTLQQGNTYPALKLYKKI